MIRLTRLNHQSLILNADLIKSIEQPHDTVITLITGEKLMVEESPDEIVRKVREYRLSHGADYVPLPVTLPGGRSRYGSR